MEAEDDDDIYASAQAASVIPSLERPGPATVSQSGENGPKPADLEEGEEEDEDDDEESDSDIDIIVERKEEPKPEPTAPASRLNAVKLPPGKATPVSADVKPPRSPAIKGETTGKATPTHIKAGATYPAFRTSSIDVEAKPIHGPTGKPITEVDMDADFSEDDKPWRRPGTDMTDYFNYGFDEFTWASYCLKQDTVRKEVADTKKQMEDMQNFMNMPGAIPPIPGMPTAPGAGQAPVPPMPGLEGIPPELQQMMQQMISQGMDPTQISPDMMMQMMGGQGGGGGGNPGQGQGQSFVGGQNFGQQSQNQGYGYGGAGGGGVGGGGGGGGGRGGRRGGGRW
ncbi:MAG: hypothetical protein Q9182_007347 [Xanthomendoza sp. 2 TL-2023]